MKKRGNVEEEEGEEYRVSSESRVRMRGMGEAVGIRGLAVRGKRDVGISHGRWREGTLTVGARSSADAFSA